MEQKIVADRNAKEKKGLNMGNMAAKPASKNISNMLHIFYGDISNKSILAQFRLDDEQTIKIDTIVNAAKPTLMGSNQGVDGAIHNKIDHLLHQSNCPEDFNAMIRRELDKDGQLNRIRCRRGHAVMTGGYGLCDNVIHVVGSICDIEPFVRILRPYEICSSSRIRALESCYYEIVKIIREHLDIRNVAVPIIGSGEYRYPFEMAVKIAFSSVGNALLEWQQDDSEYFNDASDGLQNIIFFIWKRDESDLKKAQEILKQYKEIFGKGERIVWQNSLKAQLQYLMEIVRYDKMRGYFCIARIVRIFLAFIRLLSVYTYLKDWGGGHSWQRRRLWVELTVLLKLVVAVAFIYIFTVSGRFWREAIIFPAICVLLYNMADTTTYLVSLLLMADIQKPSANIIRSLLLLLLNYMEVSLDTTALYLLHYRDRGITFLKALEPGLTGSTLGGIEMASLSDYLLHYGNMALKFFFVTMVFGYLSGHMRQRHFRS